jgi:hypothetical protein
MNAEDNQLPYPYLRITNFAAFWYEGEVECVVAVIHGKEFASDLGLSQKQRINILVEIMTTEKEDVSFYFIIYLIGMI